MAVLAHPDDETFLLGGTLAHYARYGHKVLVLCLTGGDRGENALSHLSESSSITSLRRLELEQACRMLGVELLPVQNLPDGKLSELSVTKLAGVIAPFLQSHQPEIVLTFGPDGLTGHPDHIATSKATTLAFNRAAHRGAALFYAGLRHSTVERLSNRMEGKLENVMLELVGLPDEKLPFRIDIHQTNRCKWEALTCHRTQVGSFASLNQADLQLLGEYEYFRLARVAGKQWLPSLLPQAANDLLQVLEVEEIEAVA
ncbi:MAG: PIG-L family deacetylase [Chloroflexi bacterium]|uniref:PIG-L family deacetylase n=1 Tax=Candidatus Chlorohelix allophototropha TaxID=3003348 RepID=A0A8T7LZN1_9CHLR|nr:PIG-L family deacetylase [Chloroflexota bacterium]WJW65942.1 PIG-L family deacetylase [Chloroflexota bacterium L227-S17]